jgi:membrane-bound serine protease (ClpP class)
MLYASHIAAMAPATNLGAATPVAIGGEEPAEKRKRDDKSPPGSRESLRSKQINDAAAYIRGLAKRHGRNAAWAESAVRRASNLTAEEALSRHVVDVVAPNLPSLLNRIDGMRTKPKGLVLQTAGAHVDTIRMSVWKRILDTLIDPNIVVLLMSLGALGIIVEISHPGLVFPGTVGAIALVTGLFGLEVLPVSWAGILLMLLALGLFAADVFVTSHGALTLAGAAAFVVGSLMLFDPAGPAYQVSLPVALAIGGTLALLVAVAVRKIVAVRRRPPTTGQEELVGEVGVVRRALDPTGSVFVHGELLRARSSEPIPAGTRVRVERVDEGLVLEVAPAETAEPITA